MTSNSSQVSSQKHKLIGLVIFSFLVSSASLVYAQSQPQDPDSPIVPSDFTQTAPDKEIQPDGQKPVAPQLPPPPPPSEASSNRPGEPTSPPPLPPGAPPPAAPRPPGNPPPVVQNPPVSPPMPANPPQGAPVNPQQQIQVQNPKAAQSGDSDVKGLTDISFLEPYVYDVRDGRRNPFKPPLSVDEARSNPAMPGTPLERYELEEIRLVGIMWEIKSPKAMFIDPQGEVHVLAKDDRIGRRHGYIATIREGEVVVVEPASFGGESAFSTRILSIDKEKKEKK